MENKNCINSSIGNVLHSDGHYVDGSRYRKVSIPQ